MDQNKSYISKWIGLSVGLFKIDLQVFLNQLTVSENMYIVYAIL